MTVRSRTVIVQLELVTDSLLDELKKYFGRLNGPYECMAFRVEQIQLNVITKTKKKVRKAR